MKLRYGLFVSLFLLSLTSGTVFAQQYDAYLNGQQQVPANSSPATGYASLTLDAGKILTYSISYSGLQGTEFAAHVHGPAPAGQTGPPVFSLPAGQPKNGSFGPLSAAQEADLNAGLWYINIHTTPGYSGGEIRGQISSAPVPVESATWSRIKVLYTR